MRLHGRTPPPRADRQKRLRRIRRIRNGGRLHMQHIGERAFVANLIGERAGLVEHLFRRRVVIPEADRPCHCAEQPRPSALAMSPRAPSARWAAWTASGTRAVQVSWDTIAQDSRPSASVRPSAWYRSSASFIVLMASSHRPTLRNAIASRSSSSARVSRLPRSSSDNACSKWATASSKAAARPPAPQRSSGSAPAEADRPIGRLGIGGG